MKKTVLALLTLLLTLSGHATDTSTDNSEGWTLSTRSRNNYTGISLANGTIGIVTSQKLFGVSNFLLNGVYDRVN